MSDRLSNEEFFNLLNGDSDCESLIGYDSDRDPEYAPTSDSSSDSENEEIKTTAGSVLFGSDRNLAETMNLSTSSTNSLFATFPTTGIDNATIEIVRDENETTASQFVTIPTASTSSAALSSTSLTAEHSPNLMNVDNTDIFHLDQTDNNEPTQEDNPIGHDNNDTVLTFPSNNVWSDVDNNQLPRFQYNPNNDIVGVNPDLHDYMMDCSPCDFFNLLIDDSIIEFFCKRNKSLCSCQTCWCY